ncbi:hypothetical protein KP509_07G082500 [Ceratopteris richardii]|uniref:Uncharacterized protein n=1 Tax=Ceratopteris richardii TaxID=49495 RepID=A0A8T2UJR1_CERRI|nr:hypothetical protein KP509_07G082500 [Ceratopteris richardii]
MKKNFKWIFPLVIQKILTLSLSFPLSLSKHTSIFIDLTLWRFLRSNLWKFNEGELQVDFDNLNSKITSN